MIIIQVLLPLPKIFPLYYYAEKAFNLKIGNLVATPFKSKILTGIVIEINAKDIDNKIKLKLKNIIHPLINDYIVDDDLIKFINKASDYYLTELGTVTKLVLPINLAEGSDKILAQDIPNQFALSPLSDLQQQAYDEIADSNDLPVIVKGITGSGKTELYFHIIAKALEQNEQVLLLLPEIALSEQIIQRFIKRFNFTPAIWNSTVSPAKKKALLRGIITGSVKMVIGARSGLFLPYKNLKLIIVDEEHDNSYKQEEGICYNARDMSVLRSHITGAKVILCSATPSIETLYNAQINKYRLVTLNSRYGEATLPNVQIVDLRAQKLPKFTWLSEILKDACKVALAKGEQILLFLNRRGFSPLMLCKLCGHRFDCPKCSAWLVMHNSPLKLECHHCGYFCKVPSKCPQCLVEDSLVACGPGVERIAEEVKVYFPDSKIEIISRDHIAKPEQIRLLLAKIENNEIDILVGTQIITKGYHFPNLTLVGIIDADIGLMGGDLRSSEKAYQLLHQVGGRSGREHKKGLVILQTYYPNHMVINALKENNFEELFNYELTTRKQAFMPPYSKIASIIISSKQEIQAHRCAYEFVKYSPKHNIADLKILGPAQALIFKHSGKFRYRIMIICDKKFNLQQFLKYWLSLIKIPSSCQIKIDIDPQNFF